MRGRGILCYPVMYGSRLDANQATNSHTGQVTTFDQSANSSHGHIAELMCGFIK